MTLGDLAARVAQTTPCRVQGDPATSIQRICHPRSLEGPGALVPAWDVQVAGGLEGLERLAAEESVAAVLVGEDGDVPPGLSALVARRPRLALGVVLRGFSRTWQPEPGVDPTARVAESARVAETARVGAFVVIGPGCQVGAGVVLHDHVSLGADVVVGEGSVLRAGARVGDRCRLGRRVVLMPNAVVGADGFSFERVDGEGPVQEWTKIPSIGHVVLEDDVEIGAGSCVDRANLGATRIGRGTRIDNLVQVGHNNDIGEHCLLCGQVGISGSCRVGDGVIFAGQAGVSEHRTLGRDSVVMARAAVFKDLPDGSVVFGTPARPRAEWLRQQAAANRVEPLRARVRELEARLAALEARSPE